MRRSGGNTTALLASIREADAYLPPGPIHVYSERAGGAVRLYIVHIVHISHIVANKHFYHRREVLKQRASNFSRSLCETFAFATSETVDRQIASLTVQCRQVYCLVEMAPSAPSWRPPHHGVSSTASQAGENDQTNVATQQWYQAFSTYPTLRKLAEEK
jgi:hypothetical protein